MFYEILIQPKLGKKISSDNKRMLLIGYSGDEAEFAQVLRDAGTGKE